MIQEKKQYTAMCDQCREWFDAPDQYTYPDGWSKSRYYCGSDYCDGHTAHYCPECTELRKQEHAND